LVEQVAAPVVVLTAVLLQPVMAAPVVKKLTMPPFGTGVTVAS
jgi:hypothetical protein